MPVQITTLSDENALEPTAEGLIDANGELTLEGQIIDSFLEQVDFNPIFDDPDVRPLVSTSTHYGAWDDELDCYVECDRNDPGAELLTVESMDAEDVAELIDEHDLSAMFAYYVQNELPTDTLAERTVAEVAYGLVDPQYLTLDEKKAVNTKGWFRRLHKQGGREAVNRYLGAMIAKGIIKRAKAAQPGIPRPAPTPGFTKQGGIPGAGYKGGDYTKAAGYPSGTKPRIAIWRKFKLKTVAQTAKKLKSMVGQKTTATGKKLTAGKVKEIVTKLAKLKSGAKKIVNIAQKKKKSAKKLAKPIADSAIDPIFGGVDSYVRNPDAGLVSETASLAGAAVARLKPQS